MNQRKLEVEAIRCGTVIDHIPVGKGIKILQHLQLIGSDYQITVGFNLPSRLDTKKDIIKIHNYFFTEKQVNELCLFAPKATINLINDYEVTEKCIPTLPKQLIDIFMCPNSNCITHNETVKSCFKVDDYKDSIWLTCKYCEKVFNEAIITD